MMMRSADSEDNGSATIAIEEVLFDNPKVQEFVVSNLGILDTSEVSTVGMSKPSGGADRAQPVNPPHNHWRRAVGSLFLRNSL